MALAADTGEKRWELHLGHDITEELLIAGRTLLAKGFQATFAVDLDRRVIAWTTPHGGEIAAADGRLIVARYADYDAPALTLNDSRSCPPRSRSAVIIQIHH